MTDTDLLEKKISDAGMKKVFLADKLGISAFSLAKKIKNEVEFKPSEIDKLCQLLKITSLIEKEKIFFASNVAKK